MFEHRIIALKRSRQRHAERIRGLPAGVRDRRPGHRFIIGGKLNDLVSSIVNDLVMPLLLQPALKAAAVDDIRKLSAGGVLYGRVLGSTIDFLIVAVIVLFAKLVLREEKVTKK